MNILTILQKCIPVRFAEAHCDIPCGIYDPISAKIAAQTVLKMAVRLEAVELPPKDVSTPNSVARYVTVKEAMMTAQLAREAGLGNYIKVEVIGDEKTLFPDTSGLIEAAKILVKEGCIVLPYTNDDPIVAQKLVDVGCPAVMPLAAPIGSGLGIRNPYNLKIILETIKVPIVVDAGVGTASDAALAMELGADAVLMNTAIAGAQAPIVMAEAMKYAVDAGRLAYKAGRIPRKLYATASTSIEGML